MHWSLYGLMLVLPVLGYLGSNAGPSTFKLFKLFEMPRLIDKNLPLSAQLYDVHVVLGWTALILVVVHFSAAAWHQWVRHDGLLRRMWFGSTDSVRQ